MDTKWEEPTAWQVLTQISQDLEAMSVGVARLKAVGKAMGDELDHGNKLIDRIGQKVCGLSF